MAEQFSQQTNSLLGLQKEMPLPFSTIISRKDINAEIAASKEETEKMDFSTLYGMAIDQEWIGPTLQNNSFRLTTAPEKPLSEKELTPEVAKQLTKGLLDQRAIEDVLKMARTSGVNLAMKLADNYRNIQRNNETFASYGLEGAAAVGLAAMTDPAEIAAITTLTAGITAATGGIGTVPTAVAGGAVQTARGLKKAYSVSKALKTGFAVGALEAASVESIRAKFRYDVDGGDVMLAALIGGSVGGGLNAATMAFTKRAKIKNLARRNAAGDELTADELRFLEENDGDVLTERMIDEAEARDDFEEPEARGDFVSTGAASSVVATSTTPAAEASPPVSDSGVTSKTAARAVISTLSAQFSMQTASLNVGNSTSARSSMKKFSSLGKRTSRKFSFDNSKSSSTRSLEYMMYATIA